MCLLSAHYEQRGYILRGGTNAKQRIKWSMSPCGNIGGKQEAGMKCVSHAASHGRVSQEEVTAGTKCPVCEYVWHIQGLAKKTN